MVRSTTEGAGIFIDGERVAAVPQKLPLVLPPGTHTIKVSKPGFSDYLDTFTLKKGQELVLELDLLARAGVLQITCNADDALVVVDQRQIGNTPFDGEIPDGHRVLEVRAPAHSTFRKELDVVAGETYRFDAQLVPMAGGGGGGDVPWYGHWWVWTAAAVAVAGGVTAGVLVSRPDVAAEPRNRLELDMIR